MRPRLPWRSRLAAEAGDPRPSWAKHIVELATTSASCTAVVPFSNAVRVKPETQQTIYVAC
jgi:hypothetical protein